MTWDVEFYQDEKGNRPVEEFLQGLPAGHLGKVFQVLQMLEERGPNLPFPYSSQVEGRLRELRVHFGRTLYRILYYGGAERTFVLLHALEKRTAALPMEDVALAARRMEIDQKRKGGKR
jgi:phage-related protein